MHEKWFISDTHFFHENIIQYCGRPFANADMMNECLITNWNNVVGKNDYVYHLGDWFIGGNDRERNEILYALNGKIRFIVGNHDEQLLKSKSCLNRFEKIMYWKGFAEGNFTATHVPHELKRLRDGAYNVHGHVHNFLEEDSHYINVCVETRDYTPVNMSVILEEIKNAEYKNTNKRYTK
jgi:calcineurin-like phosphoesterase family protein